MRRIGIALITAVVDLAKRLVGLLQARDGRRECQLGHLGRHFGILQVDKEVEHGARLLFVVHRGQTGIAVEHAIQLFPCRPFVGIVAHQSRLNFQRERAESLVAHVVQLPHIGRLLGTRRQIEHFVLVFDGRRQGRKHLVDLVHFESFKLRQHVVGILRMLQILELYAI